MSGPTPLNARITTREDLGGGLFILRAVYDSGAHLEFEPGQFVNLGLPPRRAEDESGQTGLVKRPYSIASAPKDAEIEFIIRVVDGGALTPLLMELQVDDRVWMEERAIGKFTLAMLPDEPVAAERDLVMVSTGTGIAPFISMLRQFEPRQLWRRFVLINGVRIETDLGYRAELEAMAAERDDVVYVPILSKPGTDGRWTGLTGRVDSVLAPEVYEAQVGATLEPQHCQVFLCGNPNMIDEVEQDLDGRGFKRHRKRDPGQLHLERYW
ncbi:ferredoxin--NADP reductase [Engelhardtia mirabilis]|uniref:ferredoxin--NADP(+) reductase n=1 Tax=Engelhardtia mirabilis TaxID=2528011 RepID=A0A518BMR1_9BACT|nr:Ferredoxin--NADP reductase [Planctomycetes bacterium Pla133]QDV02591.1 Ferredoxin--NADP reductase [Planctomycetes bacterium Pla86]